MSKPIPPEIEKHLSTYADEFRSELESIRDLILDNFPDLEEALVYGVPGFKFKGKGLVCYAGFKHHCGFYPMDPDVQAAFAKELAFDLDEKPLTLEDLWINILPEGGIHTAHIHPHSVVSGTTYVAMPEGTSALKLEDPRHAMMMASPPRTKDAPEELQQFIYIKPKVGDVLMWESWLRHEVPMNMAEDDRISVSFNYRWGD